jgi:hypothetical protein
MWACSYLTDSQYYRHPPFQSPPFRLLGISLRLGVSVVFFWSVTLKQKNTTETGDTEITLR